MSREAELTVLKEKMRVLQFKIHELEEDEKNESLLPQLRQTVGRCFKFLNSYSGDQPKWPLYAKIVSIDENDCVFNTIEFQKTSMNRIDVEYSRRYNWNGEDYFRRSNNWEEVSLKEYNNAKKQLFRFLTKAIG